MVKREKGIKKKEKGRKKEGNQDGGCNRRYAAGGLFIVTEGGQERDGGVRRREMDEREKRKIGEDEWRTAMFREKTDCRGFRR